MCRLFSLMSRQRARDCRRNDRPIVVAHRRFRDVPLFASKENFMHRLRLPVVVLSIRSIIPYELRSNPSAQANVDRLPSGQPPPPPPPPPPHQQSSPCADLIEEQWELFGAATLGALRQTKGWAVADEKRLAASEAGKPARLRF